MYKPYYKRTGRFQKKPRRIGRIIRRTLLVLFCFFVGSVVGLSAVFYYYSLSLPAIGPLLKGYDPPQVTRILSEDGVVIGELFEERRTVVPVSRIPKVMLDAVIASEDAAFRTHEGLDYMGIARALYTNLIKGRRSQGASTITQQVARTFFLSRKKTYERKIQEILLTKKIEERLTKDEILFLYLNQINFGHARYGVYESCRYYFGKGIEDITLSEAALLAGIPKGPSIYSPITHPKAAASRRTYVLGEMRKLGMISMEDHDQAVHAPLGVSDTRRLDSRLAPEAVSMAIEELEEVVDVETLRHGGYVIETTVDATLQRAAREAVMGGLTAIDERHGRTAPFKQTKRKTSIPDGALREGEIYWGEVVGHDGEAGKIQIAVGEYRGSIDLAREKRYNPNDLGAEAFAPKGVKLPVSLIRAPSGDEPLDLRLEVGPQASLVALRPQDGTVITVVGGDAVLPGGFNRAAAAKRQPGSAFKPLVYLAAIRTGRYTAATLLDDAPEVHGEWQPKNAHEDYAGAVRLRVALSKSLNLPAVKLLTDIGPETAVELANRLGIRSPLEPVPSLALGASAVSPLELTSAYAAIANKGKAHRPTVLKRVVGPDGVEIPLSGRSAEQVLSEQEAYIATSLLMSVVQSGTGAKAKQLGRPAAGKTGTSNEQRDAWFVGFTPDIACAVWVGYDDLRSIGKKEYGARAALPIWIDFMAKAHHNRVANEFVKPSGIVEVAIDSETGLLAYEGMEKTIKEVFIEGTEPTEVAVPPDLVSPESFLMDQLAERDAGDSKSP